MLKSIISVNKLAYLLETKQLKMNNDERINRTEETQSDEFITMLIAEGHQRPRMHSFREAEFEYLAHAPEDVEYADKELVPKPLLHHEQPRHHRSNTSFNAEDHHLVRIFEMNSKGLLVKKRDSIWSRSTNNIVSSEGEVFMGVSPTQSLSVSRGGLDDCDTSSEPYSVLVIGKSEVGKTALCQQFQTSVYLGGFDTSLDGEVEKTVNVLLNGEETVLSFLERSDLDDLDETIGNTVMAYIIVYACDDRPSFDRAVDILYTLRQKQHRHEIIIFVGNKSDLVRSRSVTTEEAKAVAKTYDCKFIETSVVLNVHVDELLVGVVKQLRIRNAAEVEDDKVSPGCASTSKSLLSKIFKKDNISKSCENLYT